MHALYALNFTTEYSLPVTVSSRRPGLPRSKAKEKVRVHVVDPHLFRAIGPLSAVTAWQVLSQPDAMRSAREPEAVQPGHAEQVGRELPAADAVRSAHEPAAGVQPGRAEQLGRGLPAADAMHSAREPEAVEQPRRAEPVWHALRFPCWWPWTDAPRWRALPPRRALFPGALQFQTLKPPCSPPAGRPRDSRQLCRVRLPAWPVPLPYRSAQPVSQLRQLPDGRGSPRLAVRGCCGRLVHAVFVLP
jgi:hypothetical protein